MSRSPNFKRNSVCVLAFVALAFGVFLYWVALSGQRVVPTSTYRLRVAIPSAVSLARAAEVRRAGIKIGNVTGIETERSHVLLDLSIDTRYAPAYRDARVLVRGKSLLGENYVDLDPGTPAAGAVPHGGSLPLGRPGGGLESTQLDQALATLDARRRRDVQRILDVLGRGLDRRGKDLNRFLAGSAGTLTKSRPVNATLAADRTQVAALVDDFGRVMRAVADRKASIHVLARRGHALARAVAARDDRLRDTLAALPGFLRQARTTTSRLGTFSGSATPVMRDLRIATQQLAPTISQLRPAADSARATMRALDGFTREASPLARRLRGFSTATTKLTGPLEATLRELNPLVAYLSRYGREWGSLFGALRAGHPYDAIGHHAIVGSVMTRSFPAGMVTPEQDKAIKALFNTGVLIKADLDTRGYNAYPKPGSLLSPKPYEGSYERLERDPPYGRTR